VRSVVDRDLGQTVWTLVVVSSEGSVNVADEKKKKFRVMLRVSHLEESIVEAENIDNVEEVWWSSNTESEYVKELDPEIVDVEEVKES
jgi:hypothetical protein